jgi:CRISPR system Cascade subunit CasE
MSKDDAGAPSPAPIVLARLRLKRDDLSVAPIVNVITGEDDGKNGQSGISLNIKHRFLFCALAEKDREVADKTAAKAPFLWREESSGVFFWLGPNPSSDQVYFDIEAKPFIPVLTIGQRLEFKLRVNATTSRHFERAKDGLPKSDWVRGKRVDVVIDAMRQAGIGSDKNTRPNAGHGQGPYAKHRENYAKSALTAWLEGQGIRHGFKCLSNNVEGYRTAEIPRTKVSNSARFAVSDLSGLLEVNDPAAFAKKLIAGFGHAKAFGCGLMMIRPVQKD